MNGKLYGVGVGPGDPELMTLKAVRVIREADLIVLPALERELCRAYRIARCAVPEIEDKEILCRNVPMTRDGEVLELAVNAVSDELAELLAQGLVIAFLTTGDPSVYSTYHYVHRRILEAGLEAEVVSGVLSFCAAAGRLGLPLAKRDEQIHIVPGSGCADIGAATTVYMNPGSVMELRAELEKEQQLNVYGVANCGTKDERLMRGIEELDGQSDGQTVVIVRKCKEDSE